MKAKDYVIVTAISSYRMRYVMHRDDLQKKNPLDPVNAIEWAHDTVIMERCEEFSQEHMGEYIIDTMEMNEDDIVELFYKENDYLSEWTREQKLNLVRKSIDSDEQLYRAGDGVSQDDKTAVKSPRQSIAEAILAAEQGKSSAQFNLGFMYENGKGVAKNYKIALKWYRLAAEQGDADALTNLGNMYHNGYGVPQDDKTAVKWWKLAAEQGDAKSQYNLDIILRRGEYDD